MEAVEARHRRAASASRCGVAMSDPKQPRWPKPVSSSTMASTLGAPAGGLGSCGKRGVDSAGVKPIRCGGSAGSRRHRPSG